MVFELVTHSGKSAGITSNKSSVEDWFASDLGTAFIGRRGKYREKLYFMGDVKSEADLNGADNGLYYVVDLKQYKLHIRNAVL